MINNTTIKRSCRNGNYDDLRNNRKIETENFMMAAIFTRTKIKREDFQKEMKSICVKQWIDYFKD